MAFNTGNPLGSSDPRDLYDNAENLDELVNSESKDSHPDRLGKGRKSWHGMEQEFDADQTRREDEFQDAQDDKSQRFDALLAASGYEYLADYASGIEVTEYNQVIRDTNGEFWRASGSTSLPYTTDGTGLPEGGAFVSVGDAALRQDLAGEPANGAGALRVRGAVLYVDTIADLQALPTSGLVDGQRAGLTDTQRSGDFAWRAGDQTISVSSDHLEGLWIAPESDPSGASGAWMRLFDYPAHAKWFGILGDGAMSGGDSLSGFYAAADVGYIGKGVYDLSQPMVCPSNRTIYSDEFYPLIRANNRDNAVLDVSDTSRVTLRGLELTQNSLIDDDTPGGSAALLYGGAENLTLERCYIHDCVRHGMQSYSKSTNVAVRHNVFEKTAGALTTLDGENIVFEHNTVNYAWDVSAVAFNRQARHCIAAYNLVYNAGKPGPDGENWNYEYLTYRSPAFVTHGQHIKFIGNTCVDAAGGVFGVKPVNRAAADYTLADEPDHILVSGNTLYGTHPDVIEGGVDINFISAADGADIGMVQVENNVFDGRNGNGNTMHMFGIRRHCRDLKFYHNTTYCTGALIYGRSGSQIDRLSVIGGYHASEASRIIDLLGPCDTVIIDGLEVEGGETLLAFRNFGAAYTVNTVIVRNVTANNMTGNQLAVLVDSDVTINNLIVEGCTLDGQPWSSVQTFTTGTIVNRIVKPAGNVAELEQTISSDPTSSEVLAIQNKVNTLVRRLVSTGTLND